MHKQDSPPVPISLRTKALLHAAISGDLPDPDQAADTSSSPLRERFATTAFPRSLAAISATAVPRESPVHRFIDLEIKEKLSTIIEYANELTSYLELRSSFHDKMLRGDVNGARTVLDQVYARLGTSLWHFDAQLLLAQQTGGLAASRAVLADLRDQSVSPRILFFTHFYGQRHEPEISAAGYERSLNTLLADAREQPERARAAAHMEFRLNYFGIQEFRYLNYVLFAETGLPVIDQYETFVRVLQLIAAAGPGSQSFDALRVVIAFLSPRLPDARIRTLHQTAFPERRIDTSDSLQAALFRIADLYTCGDYSGAAKAALHLLPSNPMSLELYEFHIRSLLYGSQEVISPFHSDCLARQIHGYLHSVLAKNSATFESLASLRKLSHILDGAHIGPQLRAFVLNHTSQRLAIAPNALRALAASAITPRNMEVYVRWQDARLFLDACAAAYGDGPAIDLFRTSLPDTSAVPVSDFRQSLDLTRARKYLAHRLEREGRFEEAASDYMRLADIAAQRPPLAEEAALGLHRCLLATKDYRQWVEHIVEVYLTNRYWLSTLDVEAIGDLIPVASESADRTALSWPIFLHFTNYVARITKDYYPLYVAYDDYLTSRGVLKPSDLPECRSPNTASKHLAYFLRHVCVQEVMRYSPTFRNSSELESERIAVCRALVATRPQEARHAEDEIFQLTKASAVQRAIRGVGDRKVHVDTAGIKGLLGPAFRERFESYLANKRIEDARLKATLALKGVPLDSDQRVLSIQDTAFRYFRELFAEIKNHFISSNEYGLDSYLSVRVRHGALSGELRRPFEAVHLITRKESADGVYRSNDYWQRHLAQYGSLYVAKLDDLLRTLSAQVDAVIDRVQSQWIQIRGPANEHSGLFDFDFSTEQLVHFYSLCATVDDLDLFTDSLFEFLWTRTEEVLHRVRMRIETDLRNELLSLVNELEAGVVALGSFSKPAQLMAMIAQCRTEIQNELEVLGGWFKLVEGEGFADFNMEHVVNTAVEITQRFYPSHQFVPAVYAWPDVTIKGAFFLQFIDILFIVFENILRHSKVHRPDVKVALEVCDGVLSIDVTNELPHGTDVAALRSRLEAIRQKAHETTTTTLMRTEGGSGYHKLRKLLRIDLARHCSKVVFDVPDDGTFRAHLSFELERLVL